MDLKPSAHLLAELDKQGVKEPENGFIADDAEYAEALRLIQRGHPHESASKHEERATYKLIWDHYGIPKESTERGIDIMNARRVQEVHQSHRELTTVHLPAMQQAITDGLGEISDLSAKQHAAILEDKQVRTTQLFNQFSTYYDYLHDDIREHWLLFAALHSADRKQLAKYVKYAAIWAIVMLLLMLVLTFFSVRAYAQVDCVGLQESGVAKAQYCAPFKLNFTGCTVTKSGTTSTIACTGGTITNNPGGSDKQVQYNNAGAFGGIALGSLGQVLISQGAGAIPAFADPLVQGTQADLATATANPVVGGGYDTAGTPAIHRFTLQSSTPGGTDFGLVVRNIPSGTQAVSGTFFQSTQPVSEADAANVTLGAKADAKSAATDTTAISAMSVLKQISASVQAPPSQAVTGPLTDTQLRATAVPVSGTVTTSPPSNASTNVAQINAVTPLMGNGITGTGSQRVTIASDNTAFSVNAAATLAAETTKVIGTVNVAASQTIGLAAGSNVIGHVIADSGSTTAVTSLPANASVNVAQINAVTPLMGNGTTGTGSQRVTIASDNTAFSVNATAVGTLSDNNAAPSTTNVGAMDSIARVDYRGGTAATAGRLAFPDSGTDGLLHVAALPDTSLKRFRASSKFAASSTTDNWRISGNASNTVIVTKLSVTCTATTAAQVSIALIKRSQAASGGTAATPAPVPLDSNKAAASSVVNTFTGTGPTVGTAVGDIDDAQFGCMAAATATPNDIYIPVTSPGAPLAVLRGVAEGLALNVGGAITGGNLTVSVEWVEVTTILP